MTNTKKRTYSPKDLSRRERQIMDAISNIYYKNEALALLASLRTRTGRK